MRLVVEGEGAREARPLSAAALPDVSRAAVMKYLKEGRALLNGHRARGGLFVREGDEIELPDLEEALDRIGRGQPEGQPVVVPPAPPDISLLYEDEYIVVVDKPGLVMHPGTEHEDEGLDMILRRYFCPSTRSKTDRPRHERCRCGCARAP
jgi:23S rRNA-/tRNA-specific pseudouridylate synthase